MRSDTTLKAFTEQEFAKAKVLLATQVANMMGRKLEETDWNEVYCAAKDIPRSGWSNLNIDVNYSGLGVEQKLLRVSGLRERPIKSIGGTTMMHPAATRSIRIENAELPAETVMRNVFQQYSDLIDIRTEKVRENSSGKEPDMRLGWLLWEDSLAEFLYFEEPLVAPLPNNYYAVWNETPPRGTRKDTRSPPAQALKSNHTLMCPLRLMKTCIIFEFRVNRLIMTQLRYGSPRQRQKQFSESWEIWKKIISVMR